MAITLDQARALDALARHGTFVAAAAALRKGHTAVLYALRTLEEQTGLVLLDRRAYRTRLTPAGVRLVEECRRLLAAERAVAAACAELKSGWEPRLGLVFDGIYPAEPILREVGRLVGQGAPTRFDVRAEFLAGVEDTFARAEADLMISVLAPRLPSLAAVALPPVPASLVAHRSHALGAPRARRVSRVELEAHVLLTVRGSDPRLELPTAGLEGRSTIRLNDFATKKSAILAGIGFGWMPDALVAAELRRGVVRRVRWAGSSIHAFRPHLYHHADAPLGRAARHLVEALRAG